MGIHINSVISTTIQTFDNVLYQSICDKEEYLYDVSVLGESFYKPYVQSLNDAIISWMVTTDRESYLSDLTEAMFASIAMGNSFIDVTTVTVNESTIFEMGGSRDSIKSTPLNGWDDGSLTPSPTSPTLETIVANISNPTTIVSENSNFEAAINDVRNSFVSFSRKNLWEDLAQTNNTPYTKQDIGNIVFIDNGYANIYKTINKGTLTLPSYIV